MPVPRRESSDEYSSGEHKRLLIGGAAVVVGAIITPLYFPLGVVLMVGGAVPLVIVGGKHLANGIRAYIKSDGTSMDFDPIENVSTARRVAQELAKTRIEQACGYVNSGIPAVYFGAEFTSTIAEMTPVKNSAANERELVSQSVMPSPELSPEEQREYQRMQHMISSI